MRTYYEVLQISQDATLTEIRTAYRQAMRKSHPDLHADAPVQTQKIHADKVTELNEAWQILSNTNTRDEYDLFLNSPDDTPDELVETSEETQTAPSEDRKQHLLTVENLTKVSKNFFRSKNEKERPLTPSVSNLEQGLETPHPNPPGSEVAASIRTALQNADPGGSLLEEALAHILPHVKSVRMPSQSIPLSEKELLLHAQKEATRISLQDKMSPPVRTLIKNVFQNANSREGSSSFPQGEPKKQSSPQRASFGERLSFLISGQAKK